MNSFTRHPMDEMIAREVQELRNPVSSGRMDQAIRIMQSPPATKATSVQRWPLAVGFATAAIVAAIVVSPLGSTNAYASELKAVGQAQSNQKVVYQKSLLFGGYKKPMMIMEFWTDHEKQTYRQTSGEGKLQVVIVSDGQKSYTYVAANPKSGMPESATVREDNSPHFSLDSMDSLLASKLFRQNRVQKKSCVNLNGRLYDLYSVGKSESHRYWIDPKTKLPMQREIDDAEGSIWKRDFYQYPGKFSESTFKPYMVPGLKYKAQKSLSLGNPQKVTSKATR